MRFSKSQIIAVGMSALAFSTVQFAHADPTPLEKMVNKMATVTVTFKMTGGEDAFAPSKVDDVQYERAETRRSGTYTIEAPILGFKQVSALQDMKLPRAQILKDSDGQMRFSTKVNAETTDIGFAVEKSDGKLTQHFDRGELQAAIKSENQEITRKLEQNRTISRLTTEFGSNFKIDSIEDSRLTATAPTEIIWFNYASNHYFVKQQPYTVTVTAHANFTDLESLEAAKTGIQTPTSN